MASPSSSYFGTNYMANILAGLTVALALVPEAVAFSMVAGVAPLVGLYAAFFVGLLAALFGRPAMISGATGAMAVVLVALVAQHGLEYLFAAVILTGILQLLAGALKLGHFVKLVPRSVMYGFVNGLAIVIFLAQLEQFKIPTGDGSFQWMTGGALWTMIGLVGLTMALVVLVPKVTKKIPSSLAAIAVISAAVIFMDVPTKTVGDVASISGSLPVFHIPTVPLTWETFTIIFPYALILAGVGLIESLLTIGVLDEMTNTKGNPIRECYAQGIANVVTGFFGGMGGCAMIGQSMINVTSGATSRLSGIAAAGFLLLFIVLGGGLIELIPLAALVGVMMMVVIGTFEWSSFRIMHRIPRMDAAVILLVSTVTVFTDLAFAVLVGVIISALCFSWEHAKQIEAVPSVNPEGTKVYQVKGTLFFGSAKTFLDLFSSQDDPEQVEIDFAQSRVFDHSGIDAISRLASRYESSGKKLRLKHLSVDCQKVLRKAGPMVTCEFS